MQEGTQDGITQLVLVRHGETAWNRESRIQGHTDIALSDHGQWQARQVGRALRDVTVVQHGRSMIAWEPDIQNYLGYAYRNAGQMDKAFAHYERALKLNPRHRGAHEYIGEAYLMLGKPAQAQAHLKALQTICLLPCEEFDDLKKKIDRYQRDTRKP